jgi:hypothetical protein
MSSRKVIADAFQDEDGCPQAGQAPAQALDCSSLSDVPSDKRNSNAERQTEEEEEEDSSTKQSTAPLADTASGDDEAATLHEAAAGETEEVK